MISFIQKKFLRTIKYEITSDGLVISSHSMVRYSELTIPFENIKEEEVKLVSAYNKDIGYTSLFFLTLAVLGYLYTGEFIEIIPLVLFSLFGVTATLFFILRKTVIKKEFTYYFYALASGNKEAHRFLEELFSAKAYYLNFKKQAGDAMLSKKISEFLSRNNSDSANKQVDEDKPKDDDLNFLLN